MTARYEALFDGLRGECRMALIPFVQLGDAHCEVPMTAEEALSSSFEIIAGLVAAGADALELGIPFSDPVADGPTIQAAGQRALRAGVTPGLAFELVARIRDEFPDIPIGLLVYANLVFAQGTSRFYAAASRSGVDSVLIADVPLDEGAVFSSAARRHHVQPVYIATPECSDAELRRLGELGGGYTYVVTRSGVTGANVAPRLAQEQYSRLLKRLREANCAPPVFGFGISSPDHVRDARLAGAAGAISGSRIVGLLVEQGIESAAEEFRAMRVAAGESAG